MPECIVRFSGDNLKKPRIISSLVALLTKSNEKHLLVVSAPREIQDLLTQGLLPLRSSSGNPQILISQIKDEVDKIKKEYGLSECPKLTEALNKLDIP